MAIPNLLHEVEAARQKYPLAWADAHTGNARTEDFIRLLARDVRLKHGPRWGLNGKRGNPQDISDDVLAYQGEGSAVDVTNGNSAMEIIDVIGGAGGPNPQPVWNVGPGGPGDRGAFVGTFTVPGASDGTPPPPPVKPCPDPKAHEPKPPTPYPADESIWDAVAVQLLADMKRAGQPTLDTGSGRWFARTIWRHVNQGMSLQASIAVSRVEWCQVLGIPVQ